VQIIARHIATSAHDLSNQRLLARQRRAARSYLGSLTRDSATRRINQILIETSGFAAVTAHNALAAATAYAAEIVTRLPLKTKLQAFAVAVGAPQLGAASSDWKEKTGSPVSVWTHWLDSLRPDKDFGPGLAWKITRNSLDPTNLFDRISLRKSPALMSERGARYLSRHPKALKNSDAGLLLEQQRSAHPIQLHESAVPSSVFRKVARHKRDLAKRVGMLTLEDWVSELAKFPTYDPRVGEWTALEIVRQLVSSVGGVCIAPMDLGILETSRTQWSTECAIGATAALGLPSTANC
jgi:hypothetical protein